MTAPADTAPRFAETRTFLEQIKTRVGSVVVGQDVVVERVLISLLTSGHLLLQGVPGLAKTLLVAAVSKTVDLSFSRIQFTIDLLPSDIVGSEILDQKTHEFRIHKGPIFTNLLLADEINRAAPKVQSALLEAMQERRVTIGNDNFALPAPFLVIATQNPVEQAGTFELPEAQLDRFMLLHRLEYLNLALNNLSKIHVDALVAGTLRLSHVMRNDHNGKALFQLSNELLNSFNARSVEGRTRFIHEDDTRF